MAGSLKFPGTQKPRERFDASSESKHHACPSRSATSIGDWSRTAGWRSRSRLRGHGSATENRSGSGSKAPNSKHQTRARRPLLGRLLHRVAQGVLNRSDDCRRAHSARPFGRHSKHGTGHSERLSIQRVAEPPCTRDLASAAAGRVPRFQDLGPKPPTVRHGETVRAGPCSDFRCRGSGLRHAPLYRILA